MTSAENHRRGTAHHIAELRSAAFALGEAWRQCRLAEPEAAPPSSPHEASTAEVSSSNPLSSTKKSAQTDVISQSAE
jgi:hypothetical protein